MRKRMRQIVRFYLVIAVVGVIASITYGVTHGAIDYVAHTIATHARH